MHFTWTLVASLHALGYQTDFVTGFYYKPEKWKRWFALLPPGLRVRLERQLQRRHDPRLDRTLIETRIAREVIARVAGKLGATSALQQRLLVARNRAHDRYVASMIERKRPALVIAHDTAGEFTLNVARARGVVGILNQVVGHLAVGAPLLAEERLRDPAFAPQIPLESARLIESCRQEALAAQVVLAPSTYVGRTLEMIGVPSERISLLPFGVDTERFKPAARQRRADGRLRLLYVGQIGQRKGIRYLLEALRLLNTAHVEMTLVGSLACDPTALKPYDRLFRHIPSLPHKEIHLLYQQADAFIYPSLHEGSALAVQEAMASGLPVITTANSGSMVEDSVSGFIVPIRDTERLAAAIDHFISDADRRVAMGDAARRRTKDENWDCYRERLSILLKSLLPMHHARMEQP